jgi:hypothetical protein
LKRHTYDKGERLLEPGMLPQSLFVIGSGVLSFSRQNGAVDDGVPPHRLTNWFTTRLQRLYDISNAA